MTLSLNRFLPTPIQRFPSLGPNDNKDNEDAAFWKHLQFPVSLPDSYVPSPHVSVCSTAPYSIAVTAAAKIQIYHPESNELVKTFTKFKEGARGGVLRADGQLLLAGTDQGPIKLFDVATKTNLRTFRGHSAAVPVVDFVPDRKHIVSYSDDRSVRVWDVAEEKCVEEFKGHEDYVRAGCVSSISPDILISGSYDHTVRLWDRRRGSTEDDGQESLKIDHGSPVEAVLLLPNDTILVTAGGHDIKFWDLVSGGRLLSKMSPHNKTITSLGFSNQKRRIVSSSLDCHIKFHDVSAFKTVHSVKFPSPVLTTAVAPDDSFIAAGMSDGLVQFVHRKPSSSLAKLEKEKERQKKPYLQFTEYTPAPGDYVIKEEKQAKEAVHDRLLRKFEHSKALDQVLKPYVQKNHPEYGYSVLLELKRRGVLQTALAGRTEATLAPIMTYLCRHVADCKYQKLLIEVADILLDLYGPSFGSDPSLDGKFVDLRKRVEREVRNVRFLIELQGSLDLILNAAKTSKEPELRSEEIALKQHEQKKGTQESKSKNDFTLTWEKLLLY